MGVLINNTQSNYRCTLDQDLGERVVLQKNGLIAADLTWQVAQELGQMLLAKGQEAEKNHWARVEKKLGHALKVKKVLGLPVLENADDMERLGQVCGL